MGKKRRQLYGLHLEVDAKLEKEDLARLNQIFKVAKESITKLKLKENPKISQPVKPSMK
jgi:hypothetical protein